MPVTAHTLPYEQTRRFSRIVLDYLKGTAALTSFYAYTPDAKGISAAIDARKTVAVDRQRLVTALRAQYAGTAPGAAVAANIDALLSEHSFTVCTAHQPNLFTGPLYFLYKIMHAIRLADSLQSQYPELRFVPVYYMGSEDADLDELNHFTVQGKRYTWHTSQSGAVGRMLVDQQLLQLLTELEGQLSPFTHGNAVAALLRKHFVKGASIQQATFALVHELFQQHGLVVLIPDNAVLKAGALDLFGQELFAPVSAQIVADTSDALARHYNVQAHPREINLFYLEGNMRERIIRTDEGFAVNNSDLRFDEAAMKALLSEHPERFSPNVILRGLFQETILPNIAFIGGGGELAYWLQLRALFDHYSVPYPVLVLRNSFMLLEPKWSDKIGRLGFTPDDCFGTVHELMGTLAQRNAAHPLKLNGKLEQAEALFDQIREQAAGVDPSLSQHVMALKTASIRKLKVLEQKMLRAEKRKHADSGRQIEAISKHLFPGNGLQERVDSFLYYYAVYGPGLIELLLHHSLALEQQFTILAISGEA